MSKLKGFLGNELEPGNFVIRANKNHFKLYIILTKYSDDQFRVGTVTTISLSKTV